MRLFRYSMILTALITAYLLLIRPLKANPSSADFINWANLKTCRQPCWQRIRPGITTVEQTKAILSQDTSIANFEVKEVPSGNTTIYYFCGTIVWDSSTICVVGSSREQTIFSVEITLKNTTITLGDAILALDTPVNAALCGYGSDPQNPQQQRVFAEVNFKNRISMIIEHGNKSPSRFLPSMKISSIQIKGSEATPQFNYFQWLGFKYKWWCVD